MLSTYVITNIHTDARYPGAIHATLAEEGSGQGLVTATMDYIVNLIHYRKLTVSNYRHILKAD